MPVYSRKQLSSGGTGHGVISVTATIAANAQTIHQVQATSTSALESVWLKARNRSANDAVFVMVLDAATATGIAMPIFLGGNSGGDESVDLFKGLPLTGTDSILRAYLATGIVAVNFEGYYNEIATG